MSGSEPEARLGLFVGIGVDEYDAAGLDALDHAVSDVRGFRELLGAAYEGEPLENPEESAVRSHLKTIRGAFGDGTGALVVLWAGHAGRSSAVPLRLAARDSELDADDGLDIVGDVMSKAARSGANQILVIVDACHAGDAAPGVSIAAEILAAYATDEQYLWAGVLASSLGVETSRDGALGQRLRRLLEHGPSKPELRLRWSRHNRNITGYDLCDAVLKEWDSEIQTPRFTSDGSAWWMFRNPLYVPDAPDEVVAHLLLAARGGAPAGSWFTGRVTEVDRVVEWVRSGVPGLHVVTGSAGTGKSAIVGRVVSLSNPAEREQLASAGGWDHTDPGENAVTAHVHARGLTADAVAAQLGEALVRAGVLERQDAPRNASELAGQVQRAFAQSSDCPVIVVDGLDEARGEAFTVAEKLLVPLAAYATVIVSTRELRRNESEPSMLTVLAPDGTELDLDTPAAQERLRADIGTYVARRLSGVSEAMDAGAIAALIMEQTSLVSDVPFLLARLVADQLVEAPIDTSLPNWQTHVSSTIGEAFDRDLASTRGDVAVTLLRALTWAFGAGLPEAEWLTVADAIATGDPPTADDLTWVLNEFGRYIVQDGVTGEAVYRLAHQTLSDHLRPPYAASADAPFDPDAVPITRALLYRYATLLEAGVDAAEPTYLWLYAWRHAGRAGPEGIAQLERLVARDARLRWDLAQANLAAAAGWRFWGHRIAAASPVEKAVGLFRALSAGENNRLPDLASALSKLGVTYSELGRRADALAPTEEAVSHLRALAADNPALLPDLAGALNNLGNRYSDLGRHADALVATEDAVEQFRALAAENPAFLPDLAMALNNLGVSYGELGRRVDALAPTEEAVQIRRALAAENPAFLPDLAMALSNVGIRYAELGRRVDALAPIEEAVRIRRALVAMNPAFLPDLAVALGNLGVSYSDVGRRDDALAPSEEAVQIRRALAAENPAFLPDLASALGNLGVNYSNVGRRDDALAPSEEAVLIRRALAAENPAFLAGLARALNNVGVRYSELGRRTEAVAPTEEAVTHYRALAADNPAFLPDLAGALNNLGNGYSYLGRRTDALALTVEAASYFRTLAADNPAFLPDFAGTLTSLGNRYNDLGRRTDALASTEEAVTIRRALAADNPAFLPDLASVLDNLGASFSELGRPADAVAAADESVAIRRALAADNAVFRHDLAGALRDLGNRYGELGRPADGLAPIEEAVMHYRGLVADDPALQHDLAGALRDLGNRYGELGRPADGLAPIEEAVMHYRGLVADDPAFLHGLATSLVALEALVAASEADRQWNSALDQLNDTGKGTLLIMRAGAAPAGDARAAAWLATATQFELPRDVVGALHDAARVHRASDPEAFDNTWRAMTDTPEWLLLDPARVREWIETPTFDAERDFLAANLDLLSAPDPVVEEGLLAVSEEKAERYRRLRASAQEVGVEAAYAPLLAGVLAGRFVTASLNEQAEMLRDERDALLADAVRDAVRAAEADAARVQAWSLLDLATHGDDEAIFNAVGDGEALAALLHAIALREDTASLGSAAVIGQLTATSPEQFGDAVLYVAVSMAISGDEKAEAAIDTAVERAPERVPAWIAALAEIAAKHPEVLTLIKHLAAR